MTADRDSESYCYVNKETALSSTEAPWPGELGLPWRNVLLPNLLSFFAPLALSFGLTSLIGGYAVAILLVAAVIALVFERVLAGSRSYRPRLTRATSWLSIVLRVAAVLAAFALLRPELGAIGDIAPFLLVTIALSYSSLKSPNLDWLSGKTRLAYGGLSLATLVVSSLLLVSCGGDSKPAATPTPSGPPLTALVITTRAGSTATLKVEVAKTTQEQNQGLSNRKSLAADAGMLFYLPVRGPGFWMKDTSIPLSVAFISKCGEIVDIQDMQPLSEEIHSTQVDYRFGLEANQGWFAKNKVAVGDKVGLPADLKQAGC